MLESWEGFQESIIKRFDRKVLFHVALQRIEARKWNFSKESFQEYAMDKLALMYQLDLPMSDTIHLLIGGIACRSLRGTASTLKVDSVCESPAEFQKRLMQVLQSLIRHDKVIVYIDNVLIASDSVDTNLRTLHEVLILLKNI